MCETKDELVQTFPSVKKDGWKKWLRGEDVTPYCVKWNGKEYINYCDGIANPRDPKYFCGERILIREITNPKIYAGFTADESYNDPAIINVINQTDAALNIKVVLALLNSRVATFYHYSSSPKATKGSFPKMLIEDVRNFPIPFVSKNVEKQVVMLVNAIIEAKNQELECSELEAEIDEIVYGLYGLTDSEIDTIEGRIA